MTAFRVLLAAMTVGIVVYTLVTISQDGLDLITPFFGAMLGMGWQGQFNFDFMLMLMLSGLWTAWRNGMTGGAIALGCAAAVLGISFLAPYLLILTMREKGDMRRVLLGVQA